MKIETLLVALDFSETAFAGARWAIEQLAPRNVTLLHVIDPPDRPRYAAALLLVEDAVEATAREFAERRLREFTEEISFRAVRSEVRVGKPSAQIRSVAREIGVDLVVIGPHGDRPLPWKFLGTTAERVVRSCPVPVLVATNPEPRQPQRILTPVDDASITPVVLEWTRFLAERWNADVTLLHVWSNALYSHVASMTYATTRDEDAAQKEIRTEMSEAAAHWLDMMARTGLDPARVTPAVRYGNAGEIAVEMAADLHAGVLVMGRTGSGLIEEAVLGSTVRTVLHGSRCPILVVTEPV
jgi:nucleotide-binding universal stress UspA family protein